MKKVAIISMFFAILFAIALIVFAISSVRMAEATNHYFTEREPNEFGFGCGVNSCVYCNGKSYRFSYTNFMFFKEQNAIQTNSAVASAFFGVQALAFFVMSIYPKKTSPQETEQKDDEEYLNTKMI